MTFQFACISADTPKCLHPMLPPRRLRAVSPFARPVDDTALNIIRFTPPRPKCPLTSDVLGGKASWGDYLNSNPKPACFARAYVLLPRGTRSPSRVCACHGAFCVASPDATVTSVVPGKILSPFWVLRGKITVGSRPRLSCFSISLCPCRYPFRTARVYCH